ncbi:MAG: hypothetical protein H0S85_12120 [Desulfovibrionaceae bacterium]|jgi:hypothetical protein|nr:hypothetical protein [Desulfovibrionaceae bacterium]
MSDVIEITFDSLGLTKPLDKMTAKELRQLCMDKIPQIQGASGMTKEILVSTIKELFGLEDGESKTNPYKQQIGGLKRQIKTMREEKNASESRQDRAVMRRKINKLKKRTRRLANASA